MDNLPTGAGHAWLYIEPDGDVLPAQGINQVLGNILKDPWETIWQIKKKADCNAESDCHIIGLFLYPALELT